MKLINFDFSFDAAPTIDMVLYFRRLIRDGQRKMEETREHKFRLNKLS